MSIAMMSKGYSALFISLGSIALITFVFFVGKDFGETKIQSEWDKAAKLQAEKILKLEKDYSLLESKNRIELEEVKNELRESSKKYEESLSDIQSDFTNRLQQSEQRASIYKRKAESGANECRDLADFTAKLDRSIEEGRRVVRELSETVRQRDREIILIGKQLQSDRKLCE